MSRCIVYFVFSFVCLVGCTNSPEETRTPENIEYYRRTIGATSAAFLTATLHADELVLSKIDSGIATKLDQARVTNLLEALKRHKKRLEEMLKQTYESQYDRERDQKWLPIVQELILATDALNKYLESKNKNKNELKQYILHRDKFLEKITRGELKVSGTNGTLDRVNETAPGPNGTLDHISAKPVYWQGEILGKILVTGR